MILPLRLVNNKPKEEGIKRLPLAEQGKFFFAVHGVEAVGAKVGYAVVFSFGLQQRFNALQDGVVEAFFVGVGVDDGGCHRTLLGWWVFSFAPNHPLISSASAAVR